VLCDVVTGNSSQSWSPVDVQDLLNNVKVCQTTDGQIVVYS